MPFTLKTLFALPCLALALGAAPVAAEEPEAGDEATGVAAAKEAAPEEAVHAKAEAGGHHEAEVEEWAENRNFFTTFGGVTIARAEGGGAEGGEAAGETWETAATWGFDYSFRVNKWVGVGVFFDFASGAIQELLAGPCVFIFPWEGLFIELSPSVERDQHGELFFVARAALGYEFELTPEFLFGLYGAVDYVRGGVAFVPGVTVGFGF